MWQEDVLHECTAQFRGWVHSVLGGCPKVSLLVTSRQAIGGLDGVCEKVFTLGRLSSLGAAQLFARRLPRTLSKQELFGDAPSGTDGSSSGGGGDRRLQALQALARHPVMSYLAGHPQAISLASPLLQDRSLSELSALLCRQGVVKLRIEGIPDEDRTSVDTLSTSLSASVNRLTKVAPHAVAMFFFLGLLPGGACDATVEAIWGEPVAFVDAFARSGDGDGSSGGNGSGGVALDGAPVDVGVALSPAHDTWDTASVASMESVGTIGTHVSARSNVSRVSGRRERKSLWSADVGGGCGWKELVTPLLRASLLERAAATMDLGPYAKWVSCAEGWSSSSTASFFQHAAASGGGGGGGGKGSATGGAAIGRFTLFPFVTDFAASLIGPVELADAALQRGGNAGGVRVCVGGKHSWQRYLCCCCFLVVVEWRLGGLG